MKILHIAECAGGVDRYLSMLLPLLNNIHEQVFFCSQHFDVTKYEGIVKSVYQLEMRQTISPLRVLFEVKRIRRIIKMENPDIVYCHSSFAGSLGRLACIHMKSKVVYNPHGWAFNMKEGNSLLRLFYLNIERIMATRTDKIVCISEAEYRSALNNRICKEEKLKIILNGIILSDVEQAIPVSRASLGLSSTDYVIGMIGRLAHQKAPDIFVKAGLLIKQTIPHAVFIIVGDGPEKSWVQDYAHKHGLKVIITGWIDNPYSYLKVFDLAMLLSRWEGFGLSIVEYMAAKKNIVATRVDAIPTLIEDGVDGMLADADSPENVRDKALYVYTHQKEAEEMKEKAYQKALKQFDVQRVVAQHIELFAEMGGQI